MQPLVPKNISDFNNTVHNTDIMKLLKQLPDNSVDCIYGDPDYNVGINYAGSNYTMKFNEYIDWYIELSKECLRVLKTDGNLFMMNYPKQNAHLRVRYLDEACYDIQDYVWVYNTNVGHSPRRLTTAHRSILHCTKSKENKFYKDQIAVPYKNPTDRRIAQKLKEGAVGRMPYSWFEFDLVKNVSTNKTFHACQIPQSLFIMLVQSCTKPNDNVLILFGGSGSEIMLCKQLRRHYISAELNPEYYNMIQEIVKLNHIPEHYRLVNQQSAKPPAGLFDN